ncbi:MAG: YbaB/EbfC family nucleoid-associated protein [Clostridiales bacterium]|nr:YbaB/EbfC family nucleoid-associated protein [Clostridiales bacterium]
MFRPGMGGFGGGNMNIQNLMKQAQKMQSDMQEKMAKADEELANTTLTATAGGCMVEVSILGNKEITAIKIKPEAVDPDDVEMLEDMILAATNDAIKKADALEKELKGNTGLPEGLF